ncbi:exopolysaccharide biosynthesis protein [Aquihabitans sp. McL0605]|uniref:exopolysaccharide biosynthesis protein n=1 Tax=Aquihabitans sp. McL0605 TaxID=3415671 RepID=UPI003CF5D939
MRWASEGEPEVPAVPVDRPAPFSVLLQEWIDSDHDKTVGDLGDVFAGKSFAVTILMLMLFPALPLPTAGLSHVLEAVTVVVAAQMVLGRSVLWLPDRWRTRELGPSLEDKAVPWVARKISWAERHSHPRGVHIFRDRLPRRFLGLLIAALATAAAVSPPFSGLDTIPSMGAVIIALSMILEDIVILAVGIVVGALGVAISVAIGAAAVRFLSGLF